MAPKGEGKGNVQLRFTAEDSDAARALISIDSRFKQLERTAASTAKQSKQGFDLSRVGMASWGKELGGMVMKMGTFAAAIGLATKAMSALNAERARGKEAALATDKGMGSLAQVANSEADLRGLMREAQNSMREEGMTAQEAGALQFNLRSAGKDNMRKIYASLYGMADPAKMLEAVTTIQGAMTEKETGGDQQVLDKIFRASSATKTNATDLATATGMAGGTASLVKASDEETLAALAITARGTKSAEVAATQISALAAAAAQNKKIASDKGLMGIVEDISRRNLSEDKLYKMLGSKEAVKGYLSLKQNSAEMGTLTADLQSVDAAAAAGTGAYTGDRVGAYRRVFRGQRLSRQESTRLKMAEEKLHEDELYRGAVVESSRRQDIEEGKGFLRRQVKSMVTEYVTTPFATRENLEKYLDVKEARDLKLALQENTAALRESGRRTTEAAHALEE